MSDPYERMKASGIGLPPCPRPAGSYAPGKIFGDSGVHARTAIGLQSLPGGAPVEVELIASLST